MPQAMARLNNPLILQQSRCKIANFVSIGLAGKVSLSKFFIAEVPPPDGFQSVTEFGCFSFALLQLGQQLGGVAVVLLDGVWVLEIEVVVAGLDLVDRDLPGDFISLALLPPVDTGLQVLEADRLGHRIGLLALGDAVLVVPDFLGLACPSRRRASWCRWRHRV